jgi:aspartate carbamoyltransferase regulatory subunit
MNSEPRKELIVSAIENGTVIDHIPHGTTFHVIRILGLEKSKNQIFVGTNLDSKKYGKKGIIKVNNTFFRKEEINKIALIAPNASLIEIKDYKVVNKYNVEIPDSVERFVKCFNPNCVTNKQNVPTRFEVIDKNDLKLHCHYCEKNTARQNIEFI